MTVDEIKAALEDRNIKKVASATGLSAASIYRIVHGETTDPRISTVTKLTEYLKAA